MATTQYIGARYVPLIFQNPDDNSNNWKQGVTYDPLTIVSYAGGSYTSKTFVPATAANPVDAPQYWVSIGLYSGQTSINTNSIIQIRHAISSATEAGNICTQARSEGDYVWVSGSLYQCTAAVAVDDTYTEGINITPISDLAGAIDVITTLVNDHSSDISDINTDLLGVHSDITAVSNSVTALETKLSDPFTLMIGDSYADGYDPAGNNDGWCNYLMNLGVTGQRIHAGGSGFGLATSDVRSPMYLIQNTTISVSDDKVGRIIVCMGYNDFGANSATVRNNLTAFINYCTSRFQNATIYVGMCGYAWTHNENNIYGALITTAARDYYSGCFGTKAIFMPQTVGVLLGCNGMSTADYKHPNATGNRHIASAIWAALHGESYVTRSFYTLTMANTGVECNASVGIDLTVKDGFIQTYQHLNSFVLNHSTTVGLSAITLDSAHLPCLPYMKMQFANILHNFDFTNGLSKAYYNALMYIVIGYDQTVTANAETRLINDAGNNFASSKHFEFNDQNYYNCSGSFL